MFYTPNRQVLFHALRKTASVILAVFLLLSPLGPVFAQEVQLDQSSEMTSSSGQSNATTQDASTQSVPDVSKSGDNTTGADKSKSQSSGKPSQGNNVQLSAMSSGGFETNSGTAYIYDGSTYSAAPKVDTQTGGLQYDFPISIPQGRNGLTPDIRLQYNSNDTGNTNIFGYGWSISIPHIYRINKYGTDKLYASSTYQSSLDGELIQVGTSTSYVPRTENGDFRKYTLENNIWKVSEKNGVVMTFGKTSASRRDDPDDSSKIFDWYLSEERDRNDNYISYLYYKETGQIYPSDISYTGQGTTNGIFDITFTRESRGDNLISYDTGFLSTTSERISRIELDVSASWAKRYDLSYSTGDNANRSILTSVTESGKDSGGTTDTLPSTNFTYGSISTSSKKWSEDTSWSVPVDIIDGTEGYDRGARFVDINGDAKPDILRSWNARLTSTATDSAEQEVYLNTGTSWTSTSTWTIPEPYNGQLAFVSGYDSHSPSPTEDLGARFADVNGDGYTDIVWAYSASWAGYYNFSVSDVYINNKVDGWASSSDWTIPSDFKFVRQNVDGGGRIADVNGDGLPDLLISRSSDASGGEINKVYFNTGDGWEASSTWTIPEPFLDGYGDSGTRLADVNGDGLVDIVRARNSNDTPDTSVIDKVYLNTGSGWEYASNWSSPLYFTSEASGYGYNTLTTEFVDVNSDGLPDLVASSEDSGAFMDTDAVYINTGEGWVHDTDWTVPPYFKFIDNNNHYDSAGVASGDVDGDNMIDYIKAGPLNNYPNYSQDYGVYMHDGSVPDLLTSIEQPQGGEISYEYKTSAQYKDANGYLNPGAGYNLNTIATTTYDDGITSPYSNTYSYGGGFIYASSTDREFAGFATTTFTDARGNVTKTYIHQGNTASSGFGEDSDGHSLIGKVYRTDQLDDNDNLYQRTFTQWATTSIGTNADFVYKADELTQAYDGDSDHKDSATSYTYDTTDGSLLTKIEWGEVSGSSDGTFSDTGTDKRTTVYTYASSSATSTGTGTGGGGEMLHLLEAMLYGSEPDPALALATDSSISDSQSNSSESTETLSGTSNNQTTTDTWSPIATTSEPQPVTERKPSEGVINADVAKLLDDKTPKRKANIKAGELVKLDLPGRITYPGYNVEVEVEAIEAISGGIQVFVRGWRNGQQLGFGPDGSIEIERIRIFNPPIVVRTTGGLKEDLREALTLVLVDTVSTIGKDGSNIQKNKIGRTTDVFYPDAGTGGTTVDGRMFEDRYTVWSTEVGVTSCRIVGPNDTGFGVVNTLGNGNGASYYSDNRFQVGFDTSPIPDSDTISSATFSVYGVSDDSAGTEKRVYLVSNNPNSNNNLITSDYSKVGTTSYGVSDNTWNTPGFNDITLNSTGIDHINVQGVTNFALRGWYDFNISAPNNSNEMYLSGYSADTAGAAEDPKLIVQHTDSSGVDSGDPFWIVVPTQVTTYDNASNTVRDQKLYYDDESFGAVDVGNLTKREDWATSSTWLATQWTYNSYGLPTSEIDPRGATTTYTYDSYNLFVATTTDAEGNVTGKTYDYSSGKIEKTVDPESRVFETTYGPHDRPVAEYMPDPSTGSRVQKTAYTYDDTRGGVSVEKENHLNSATSSTMYTYLDGFGKTIQERIEAETSNQFATRDHVYGLDGLLSKESLPYFSTGTSNTDPTPINAFYTQYGYDALGRVIAATTSVGTTNTAYDQWKQTVTDALDNDKDITYDAFGQLTQVDEHNGTSTYATTYEWDPNGNLTKITDALSNVRNIAYDALGRRTRLEDLHGTSSGTYGVWQYSYDANGNLASQTDPNGNTVNYTYDDDNRPLTEDYTGQSGTEVTYIYDTCTGGSGQLCSVADESATTTYTYDEAGNIASTTKTVGGTDYTTGNKYDRQGNKILVTYPDNSEVSYTYNTAGQLEKVTEQESGSSTVDIVSDFDYGPHGLVTYELHGNGTETTRTYDEANRYRLTNIYTEATTTGTGGGGPEFEAAQAAYMEQLAASGTPSITPEPQVLGAATTSEVSTTTGSTSTTITVPEATTTQTNATTTTGNGSVASSSQQAAATSTGPVVEATTTATSTSSSGTTLPTQSATTTPPGSTTTSPAQNGTTTHPESTTTPDQTDVAAENTLSTTTPNEGGLGTTTSTSSIESASSSLSGAPTTTIVSASTSITLPESLQPLEEMDYSDRATEKGLIVASAINTPLSLKGRYDVDILSIEPVRGGIEVFARAWTKDHRQIGFGPDGSVDIERFRIINPPLLVPDQNGSIVRTQKETMSDGSITEKQVSYREDPQEALTDTIEHTISVMKNAHIGSRQIEGGKVGKTTSTFFPSEDAVLHSGWHSSWSTVRNGYNVVATDTAASVGDFRLSDWYLGLTLYRFYAEFDTSSIGTDNILSASLYVNFNPATAGNFSSHNGWVATPSSYSGATADNKWDAYTSAIGTAYSDETRLATSSGYTEFDLNSSGTSSINASGSTTLGIISYWDQVNTDPDQGNGEYKDDNGTILLSEQVGTSQDPKLIVESVGGSSGPISVGGIQNISYSYDAVGNITQTIDNSDTNAAATTTYAYDDLYRLTSASTTEASSTPYSRTYSYNAIGNITSKSDIGSYSYGETNYANPHAATLINGTTYSYDHNGNLATTSAGITNTWNYRNRLTESENASTTTTYGYDYSDQRVSRAVMTSGGGSSSSSDTGFKSPSGTGSVYDECLNPTYAYTSDDNYTSCTSHSGTNEQDYSGFSLGVPSGATIDGIEVGVEGCGVRSGGADGDIKLSWNGGSNLTAAKSDSFQTCTSGDVTNTYGGPSDTWGRSWTDSEVNDTNFLLYATTLDDWDIDQIQVKVYYTTAGSGGEGTTSTTYYPSQYYTVTGATSTKYIYAGDMLVATIEDDTPAPKVYYNHLDHLNSTRISTDQFGYIVNELDYFPFGDTRIDNDYTDFRQHIQHTGNYKDDETSLIYLGARYYDGQRGQFLSQDPIGQQKPEAFIADPQQLNVYSYGRNNPMRNVDPTGLYNVKTGEIEKGDTSSKIVSAINKAFGIKTDWSTVKDVSFYNDNFGNKPLSDLVGKNLGIGTNITADITSQLNGLNSSRANVARVLGKGSLGLFAPHMPWDIKNSNDPVLGGGADSRKYWSYIYNGNLIRYDAPGNINYGYVARATGLSGGTIQFGAAVEQGADNYIHGQGFSLTDNGGDTQSVQTGIDAYNAQQSWWQKLINW